VRAIRETEVFVRWFKRLRDREAKARILARIRRLSLGNPGQAKSVGEGISEMKVDYGPGYRIYYKQTDKTLIILLTGGDKRTQKRDIDRAKELARGL
jgi:putative addiction module killer protein